MTARTCGRRRRARSGGRCGRSGAACATSSSTDDPWEQDDLGDGVTATRLMPDVHIIPGLWGDRRLHRHQEDDRRALRRRAGRDLRRDAVRLAPRQPRRGAAAAAARRREAARGPAAQPRRQARPDRPLDGWARRPLLPRVPRRVARHAHADHVRHAVPRVAERRRLPRQRLREEDRTAEGRRPDAAAALAHVGVPAAADLPVRRPRRRATCAWPRRRAGIERRRRRPRGGRAEPTSTGPSRPAPRAHEPDAYAIHSVVGITQGTKQSARSTASRLPIEELYDGDDLGGDGTVPRVSATPIETDDLAAGLPADVLRRPARLAAERRSGADPAARHPHRPSRRRVPRRVSGGPARGARGAGRRRAARRAGAARPRQPARSQATVTDLATGAAGLPAVDLRRDADDVHTGRAAAAARRRLPAHGGGESAPRPGSSIRCTASSASFADDARAGRARTDDRAACSPCWSASTPTSRRSTRCTAAATTSPPSSGTSPRASATGSPCATLLDGDATRANVTDGVPRAPRHGRRRSTSPCSPTAATAARSRRRPRSPTSNRRAASRRSLLHDCGRRIDGKLQPALADKELALLIAEVAAKGAHVVVILDCCHSGGGTRDPFVRVRGWEPSADLVGAGRERGAGARRGPGHRPSSSPARLERWTAPAAPHVALSACRSFETAKESGSGGSGPRCVLRRARRGARRCSGRGRRTARCSPRCRRASVRTADEQHPELFPRRRRRAGRRPVPRRHRAAGRRLVHRHPGAGRLAGRRRSGPRAAPAGGRRGVRARLPGARRHGRRADPRHRRRHRHVEGRADRMGAGRRRLRRRRRRRAAAARRGRVRPVDRRRRSGRPRGGRERPLAAALGSERPGRAAPHRRLAPSSGGSTVAANALRLRVGAPAAGVARLARADGSPVTVDTPVADEAGARLAVPRLEHVARWEQVRGLGDHPSPLRDAVVLDVYAAEPTRRPAGDRAPLPADGGYQLEYRRQARTAGRRRTSFLEVRNTTDDDLYVAVLDLTDRFRCQAVLPTVRLAARHTLALRDGAPDPDRAAGRAAGGPGAIGARLAEGDRQRRRLRRQCVRPAGARRAASPRGTVRPAIRDDPRTDRRPRRPVRPGPTAGRSTPVGPPRPRDAGRPVDVASCGRSHERGGRERSCAARHSACQCSQ